MKQKRIFNPAGFISDGWELVIAIKQREEENLVDRFQEYWKIRCENKDFIPLSDVLRLISSFAAENFQRTDWIVFNENMRRHYGWNESMSISDLIKIYLVTVELMKMYYEEEKHHDRT